SPLGLPDTLSRAPLRRRAPFAWLTRCARSLYISPALSRHRRADAREMVIAVTHRVILDPELARQRRVGVVRHRRRTIELLVGQRLGEGGERPGALLEALGEGVGADRGAFGHDNRHGLSSLSGC